MSSVRLLEIKEVKSFLPSYILLKFFYFNTLYRAEQSNLVIVYTCTPICMGMSRQKENKIEMKKTAQSLYTSVLKDMRFFAVFLFPSLTVSGNESV